LERPSYWPDPGSDTSVKPAAGGKVPKARTLGSAATGKGPGKVHVVCKGADGRASLRTFRRSLAKATKKGYRLRPSEPRKRVKGKRARKLERINEELAGRCRYHSVQRAVNAAGNNDRVVIMPGRYREPESRRAPLNDPRCNPSLLQEDASGTLTPSYAYQATCRNDQNLIHVAGRAIAGEALSPPRDNRQGIPEQELGRCIRCNLQIEGSGVRPEDVILDGGKKYSAKGPEAEPGGGAVNCGEAPDDCYAKHIVMRVDRADGFVGRNFLARGSKEFGFYSEEADGVLLDRVKFFWAADYGHLSFTTDHHLIKNCDAFGAGDAAIYPGAAPETGSQADRSFYPDAPRINTVVRKCDMRGSDLGFSGSMGNATRITESDIYGNVSGIVLDTLSAAGHPGFPADSSQIDHNRIYSNNLDLFTDDPPVVPVTPAPMGVGIVYAGMNDARVHDNYIFDNWRNGTMLFSVPDALTNGGGAEGQVNPGIPCSTAGLGISTSCGNRFFDNMMGQAPPGFRFPPAIDQYGANAHGTRGAPLANGNLPMPNGNDFWWDEFLNNTGNCWFDNVGSDGTAASITGPGTSKPPSAPPDLLPSNCATSIGLGDVAREAYLIECSNGPDEDTGPLDCDWWQRPSPPGSRAARREQREHAAAVAEFEASSEADALRARMEELSG
ncbi:MAG: hypothetical protein ACRDKX_02415, partial [Solirubrobacterales bacterium]